MGNIAFGKNRPISHNHGPKKDFESVLPDTRNSGAVGGGTGFDVNILNKKRKHNPPQETTKNEDPLDISNSSSKGSNSVVKILNKNRNISDDYLDCSYHFTSITELNLTGETGETAKTAETGGSSMDFEESEGQIRRNNIADCELECSQLTKFVYVAGQKVAENESILSEKGIKRVINCAAGVIPNYFEKLPSPRGLKYLSINLLDGKQEDISWFLCQVIHFIKEGAEMNEKTLIHCEKGISRSVSMAVAYRMWSAGMNHIFFLACNR